MRRTWTAALRTRASTASASTRSADTAACVICRTPGRTVPLSSILVRRISAATAPCVSRTPRTARSRVSVPLDTLVRLLMNSSQLTCTIILTSSQSNLTERLHHHRTWTVQSYSLGGASVHHHLICASLGPPGISISSAVFAQLTAESPYILKWAAPSPLKIISLRGGSGPPSHTFP